MESPVIYLREKPGGSVLIELENGTPLRLLDERQELGGMTWRRVVVMFENSNPGGWIAQDLHAAGAAGDASRATAEKGRLTAEHKAEAFIKLLRDMTRFSLKRLA